MAISYSWDFAHRAGRSVAPPGGGGSGGGGGNPDPDFRYVGPSATGDGSGSDWNNKAAWSSLTFVRGRTYYLADGSYGSKAFDTATSGTTLITIKKATASDHGTNTGWNAADGDGQATFTAQWLFTTAYWTLDGQVGGGAADAWNGSAFGLKLTVTDDSTALLRMNSGGNNVTVRHIELVGKGSVSTSGGSLSNDAVAIYGASDFTLSYYWMHGIGRCPFFISPEGGETIAEHGWVESYFGSGSVHSEVASIWDFSASTIGNVTFRYNLFTDIQSTGGIMWDNASNNSAQCSVYGNVFYKPSGASWDQANGVIGGWTGGGGEECRNLKVYNNTFISVDQECLSTFPNIVSGNEAKNNLFYNCQSPDFTKFPTHDYNHFINSGGTHSEANGTSAASGDPFTDFVNFDFTLTGATSGGAALGSPYNTDPLGLTRGGDGTVDRGAFEYEA